MKNPIINGIELNCYNPNRGWDIELIPNILIGYVELIPIQNKTSVAIRCLLTGQDIVSMVFDGLDPEKGVNLLPDLIWQASNGKLELIKDI